jgi:hypothetical protein
MLLAAGLVAELTLSRVPVLIGAGHTPFGELVHPGGMVQSRYRVRR